MVYNIRMNYEEKLDNILRRFWEVEEVPIRPAKSGEDEFCKELYKTKRQLSLERRLAKQVPLKEEYHSFMREYIKLGHMTPLPALVAEDSPGGCFIPHHAPMIPYRLNTVTYGTSPAPFLALRTLIQLAIDEGSQYPRAAEALRKETYVDDILTAAEDSESATLLREELIICLLQKGGFVLKKWASNDPTILNQIPEDARLMKIQFDGEEVVKTLCLGWDPAGDYFLYSFQEPTQGDEITKRGMLSLVAKLYDPMGCWERLGCTDRRTYKRIVEEVSRTTGMSSNSSDTPLVGLNGNPGHSAAWIQRCLRRCTIARTLPNFVGNRVSEIQTSRQIQEWRHVPSGENPADLASRGVLGSMIGSSRLWWKGPSWLILSRDQWPKMPTISGRSEIRTGLSVGLVNQVPFLVALGELFSSITTYNRVVAWILRFISNCRGGKVQSPLNPAEIKRAHVEILLAVQQHYFGEELKSLSRHKVVGGRNRILSLNPFQDEQGVLRVGGRLRWAPGIPTPELVLSNLRQEYWILRAKDQIKKCVRVGKVVFPPSPFTLENRIGEWRGDSACLPCVGVPLADRQFMDRKVWVAIAPRMCDLLPLQSNHPTSSHERFTKGTVDPGKTIHGRGRKVGKGYICLFFCFLTRAVHIELVTDASTPTFLAAFKRFVARRGRCNKIYSDQGTNFVGVAKKLKSDFYLSRQQLKELTAILANDGTE
ncbi:hypothetical protein LAZ67_X001888 [Cordylochernes scorpioides]|uniref:Integrase catalytic domain-containing protein n=1 Tax=Cordylochernes scorpioides TaxID=51811 RepID=A0ABY6LVE3_9ARAC|nr:hypothetical protein LAZ67_X001888 [Cordylochernes scorpioides]